MSDILNFAFSEAVPESQGADPSLRERIARCRAIAAKVERLAPVGKEPRGECVELGRQLRKLADEMERNQPKAT